VLRAVYVKYVRKVFHKIHTVQSDPVYNRHENDLAADALLAP